MLICKFARVVHTCKPKNANPIFPIDFYERLNFSIWRKFKDRENISTKYDKANLFFKNEPQNFYYQVYMKN